MYAVSARNTMANARPKFREPEPTPVRSPLPTVLDLHLERMAREREARERQMQEIDAQIAQALDTLTAVRAYRVIDVRDAPAAKKIPAMDIIRSIARKYGINARDITSARRSKPLVRVRFEAIRAVADLRPDMSLPAIGRVFNRDHTTILHALSKTKQPGAAR